MGQPAEVVEELSGIVLGSWNTGLEFQDPIITEATGVLGLKRGEWGGKAAGTKFCRAFLPSQHRLGGISLYLCFSPVYLFSSWRLWGY